ncbi:hypothetical protein ACIBFB_24630 [Nocardiopsis sp. NPDC050513]|uniref:hypothetical protein n=1 Tax=Nocardiopsis sp. NPDC050513 TaxID=3364338 RepID=UPI00378E5922
MAQVAGVNPNEAHAGGVAAEQAAALLRDLPADFEDAVEAAKNALNPEPSVKGWTAFGEQQVSHMEDVKAHADAISNNIQAGAVEGGRTDQEASREYSIF